MVLVTHLPVLLSVVMNHQHQQQMAPSSLSQQNHPPQNPSAGLMSMPNALTTQQQQQQKLRLQRIQMERERIRMRQEELMRQEVSMTGRGDSNFQHMRRCSGSEALNDIPKSPSY